MYETGISCAACLCTCWVSSLTLKMEGLHSSKTSIKVHETILRHITEKYSCFYVCHEFSVFSLLCSSTVQFLSLYTNASLDLTRVPMQTLTDIQYPLQNISNGTWWMEFRWKSTNFRARVSDFCLSAQWQVRLLGNWWVLESNVLCTNEK
jgi:hypothetical protein